jgi:Importin-beta N-terminal domain
MDSITRRSQAMGVITPVVSPAELYEVIVAACSENHTQVRASSQRLKQMLEMFGSYDSLQEIAARPNTPLPIRQQAIIQFKNAVVHHWRSRKSVLNLEPTFLDSCQINRLLSEEHRMRIRQRCLCFVNEEDETVCLFL